jgi:hypothetical protein
MKEDWGRKLIVPLLGKQRDTGREDAREKAKNLIKKKKVYHTHISVHFQHSLASVNPSYSTDH